MANTESGYRRFQFSIADLLAVMVVVSVLGATSRLPVSWLHVLPMFAVLYLAKLRILNFHVRPWVALALYLGVLVALLPYLYCCATDSWNSPDCNASANWIGQPVTAYIVPTAFFLYDVLANKRPSLKFYTIRSLLELLILVPLWVLIWAWTELSLGWAWI